LVYKKVEVLFLVISFFFTVTYRKHVRREKKDKKIDWETIVEEHTKLQIEKRIFT